MGTKNVLRFRSYLILYSIFYSRVFWRFSLTLHGTLRDIYTCHPFTQSLHLLFPVHISDVDKEEKKDMNKPSSLRFFDD